MSALATVIIAVLAIFVIIGIYVRGYIDGRDS